MRKDDKIVGALTATQLEAFFDVMVKKVTWYRDPGLTDDEWLRQSVQQVVVDTFLLSDGSVPIERWLDDSPWDPPELEDSEWGAPWMGLVAIVVAVLIGIALLVWSVS